MAPIEFSALALPITVPGEKDSLAALERIDRKAQDISATIGKQLQGDLAAVQKTLQGLLAQMEKEGVEVAEEFRRGFAEGFAEEMMRGMGATQRELDTFRRKMNGTLDEVETKSRRAGSGLSRMLSGVGVSEIIFSLERVAQGTDKITDAARGALRSLSAVTAMMGPYGIATSVVLGGIAAVMDYFDQLDRRAAESARKFREELAGIVRSGNMMSASAMAQTLYSGDIGASIEGRRKDEDIWSFIGRRDGIQGLEARRAAIKAQLRAIGTGPAEAAEVEERNKENTRLTAQLVQINRVLDEQRAKYDAVNAAIGSADDPSSLMGKTSEEAKNRLNRLRDKEAEKKTRSKRGTSIEEIAPKISYAQIAAAVVQTETGGKLEQGASRMSRGVLGDLGSQLGKDISESVTEGIRAGSSSIAPALREFTGATERELKQMSGRLESMFQDALVGAFQRGFATGGIGGFVKGFGQSLLAMLGELFIEIGKKLINFGAIAETVATAIKSLGMFSGPAAIAAGVALVALGVGMGAMAGGGGGRGGIGSGGYGGSGSAPPMVIDRGLINPVNPLTSQAASGVQPQQAVQVINPVFLSPNDPTTQRQFVEVIRNASNRGVRV